MITEEIKNIRGDKKELRKFSLVIGIVLILLGGLSCWRSTGHYPWLFAVAITILLVGFFRPMLLKPIHKAWMTLAILMGWVVTRIILTILFYLIVTPIGLSIKLMGKDFLDLEFSDDAESYWILRKDVKKDRSDYERQF
jgi:hypothetical protein